jgi:hypothetical protein
LLLSVSVVRALLAVLVCAACSAAASEPDAGDEGGGGGGPGDAAPRADARPRPDAAGDGLDFTFELDLEGWIPDHGGKQYDRALFLADEGNPGGCAMLDGSDLGSPDADPNSSLSRVIELPAGVGAMKFDTRAAENGALRLRLVEAGGTSHTLLDWEVVAGPTWVSRSADLATWAGQEVTLVFEQNDNDVGIGEMRYIDNIQIH